MAWARFHAKIPAMKAAKPKIRSAPGDTKVAQTFLQDFQKRFEAWQLKQERRTEAPSYPHRRLIE
jgi:hypothetical protein